MKNEEKKLFDHYYDLMSIEIKKEISGYESFKMENVKCSIKVNFKNGDWVRLYKKMNNEIEWY